MVMVVIKIVMEKIIPDRLSVKVGRHESAFLHSLDVSSASGGNKQLT
jgi:hypothetical protein